MLRNFSGFVGNVLGRAHPMLLESKPEAWDLLNLDTFQLSEQTTLRTVAGLVKNVAYILGRAYAISIWSEPDA